MDATIETICHKTRDLRWQLRKAMADHVSDSFIEGSTLLMMLVEAALNGNEKILDGVSENYITLEEIWDIPGTSRDRATLSGSAGAPKRAMINQTTPLRSIPSQPVFASVLSTLLVSNP